MALDTDSSLAKALGLRGRVTCPAGEACFVVGHDFCPASLCYVSAEEEEIELHVSAVWLLTGQARRDVERLRDLIAWVGEVLAAVGAASADVGFDPLPDSMIAGVIFRGETGESREDAVFGSLLPLAREVHALFESDLEDCEGTYLREYHRQAR